MGAIRDYLEQRRRDSRKGLQRGSGVRALRRVTPYGVRQWAKLNGTTLLVPVSRRKAHRILREPGDLQLHLACGTNRLPGWVNIDILGMHPDFYWDLRRGIPFPDGSARAVFLEHFLEHLTYGQVLDTLAECYRVLGPGGRIRAGVPDFGRYMESYVGDGAFIEELRPQRPTSLLAVAEVALDHGHRSVWDGTTLKLVLAEAGFVNVELRTFGDSALEPAPDSPTRERETVYAEGEKGGERPATS